MSCRYSILDFGHPRREERIGRVALVQALQQRERPRRLPLVPEIDDVQLVVGLALQQRPRLRARASLAGLPAIAAGQQQEEAQELCRRRRDVGVVLVQAEAELGVLELADRAPARVRALLDALAVARRGELLVPQHAPLHARAVGAAQVEPRLRVVGRSRPSRPRRRGSPRRPRSRTRRRARVLSGSSWMRHQSAVASRTLAGLAAAPVGTRARARRSTWSNRASRMKS